MSTPTLSTGNTLLSKPPAALTKPPAPTASAQAATAAFVSTPKKPALMKKPKSCSLADDNAGYLKFLLFGHWGTGKTEAITGLLLHGLRVYVISTDAGGSGMNTVKMSLKKRGRLDLLDNCRVIELTNYDEVEAFVEDPISIEDTFYADDWDVVVWDGYSSFQQIQLDHKVLGLSSIAKDAGEAREAGLWADRTDWGQIKRASVRLLDQFLQIHNKVTGKKLHKLVTCLESGKASEDKLTGVMQKAPLIQGAAAALIGPAFDVILRTRTKREEVNGKKVEQYVYEMMGTDKLLVKSRGLDFLSTEPGDFYKLWEKATGQLGISAGRSNGA